MKMPMQAGKMDAEDKTEMNGLTDSADINAALKALKGSSLNAKAQAAFDKLVAAINKEEDAEEPPEPGMQVPMMQQPNM